MSRVLRRPHLRTLAVFLFFGLLVTLAVSLILALTVNNSTAGPVTARSADWTVTAAYAPSEALPAALRIVSERSAAPGGASWSPAQATWAPNTPNAGDYATAWAPATNAGQPEWLLLTYAQPIAPKFIDVYESYDPGALVRVTLVRDDGTEIEAWSGTDPTPATAASGVSRVPVMMAGGGPTPAVRRVKLYQGVAGLVGWNEIDAVGLIDTDGKPHWATRAVASSWYGQGSYPPLSSTPLAPEALVPSWSGLTAPPAEGDDEQPYEPRGVDARGWPFLALWTRFDPQRLASRGMTLTRGTVTGLSGYSVVPFSGRGSGYSSGGSFPTAPVLPWRPIWLGLGLDTLLYAAALRLLWAILTKPRRFFVEVSRVRHGRCLACGYDLGYDFAGGCPECGWRRTAGVHRPAASETQE